ncbi:DoxX family protein [Nocardia jejuensis]|uniref:DoxX family protein n=1 Tax=Nocardia jejuensis TaxID=328049 RepID=UPI000836A804|nr:DoxX family protein [Nocardia jejuensis]
MQHLRSDHSTGLLPHSPAATVFGLYRVLVGVSFFLHGLSELYGIPLTPYGGKTAAFGSWPHWWAGAIELVGGALVALGLGTRVAALLCSGAMAYAYLSVHQQRGALPIQNGGEAAAMFCWAFFLIAILGPGSFALAGALSRLHARKGFRAESPVRT